LLLTESCARCFECNLAFSSRQSFQKHQREEHATIVAQELAQKPAMVHEAKHRYKCSRCDLDYINNDNCRRHERTHHVEPNDNADEVAANDEMTEAGETPNPKRRATDANRVGRRSVSEFGENIVVMIQENAAGMGSSS